jgi:hypothetical protein
VTVLERDPAPVPGSAQEAWGQWERKGVPHFHQPHNLLPRYRQVLEEELPEVLDALVRAGGTWVDAVAMLPPFIEDRAPRPGDDRFRFVTARRPAAEYAHGEECAFAYYTRYFRGRERPAPLAPPVSPVGTFMVLTLPGDNESWSVTLWAPSRDRPLKEFRDPEKFTRVVRACPLHAHWLGGEPITGVLPMGGILDRYRRFAVDGEPVATGFAAVGDAWACTNPSAGRGLSVGLMHARRLRDVARSSLGDPRGFALEWDAVTESELAPWYWNQLAADQARLAKLDAVRDGRAAAVDTIPPLPPEYDAAARAMMYDADVFRAVLETATCLALPQEVFARPGPWEKVEAVAGEPLVIPGPSRSELLDLLA